MHAVFGHTVAPHRHIARQYLTDLFVDTALINAKYVRDTDPHGVHGVMRLVAVKCPVAGDDEEFDITHLADPHQFGPFRSPALFGPTSTIATGDMKLGTMEMHGMLMHRQITDPDPHPLTATCDHRRHGRKQFAVDAP